jgi:hypothetical protein
VKQSIAILTLSLVTIAWLALDAVPALADGMVPPSETTIVPTPTTATTTVGDVVGPSKPASSDHSRVLIAGGIGVVIAIAVGSIVALRRTAKRPPDQPQSSNDADQGDPR